MKIAFVSSHPRILKFKSDASFIYRCQNIAYGLKQLGHDVSLLRMNQLIFRSDFDAVVFWRPSRSRVFDYAIKRLRARGAILVGDSDDIFFDPRMAPFRPSVLAGDKDEEETRLKFRRHWEAFSVLDCFTCSTHELMVRLQDVYPGKPVLLVPNSPYHSWLDMTPLLEEKPPSISYFSGTRTHDRDFNIVVPALEQMLLRHPSLRVQVVGPVSCSFKHERLIHHRRVPFKDYIHLVRSAYLNISPLEENPYSRGKSAVKVLEAGVMNVPSVVSAVGEYAELDIHGVIRVRTQNEWLDTLEFACDRRNHQDLSLGLRERIIAYSNLDRISRSFSDFIQSF